MSFPVKRAMTCNTILWAYAYQIAIRWASSSLPPQFFVMMKKCRKLDFLRGARRSLPHSQSLYINCPAATKFELEFRQEAN